MKNKKIIPAALVMMIAFAAVVGLTQTSFASSMNKKGRSASSTSEVRTNKFNFNNNQSRELNEADRVKKQTAVQAAIAANDYNAWVIAVGENSPLLSKINKDNFYKLVSAHNLRQQADALMKELGVDQGFGRGMGMGLGLGHINK